MGADPGPGAGSGLGVGTGHLIPPQLPCPRRGAGSALNVTQGRAPMTRIWQLPVPPAPQGHPGVPDTLLLGGWVLSIIIPIDRPTTSPQIHTGPHEHPQTLGGCGVMRSVSGCTHGCWGAPNPQRSPGAVVGKSRTTGSCYRTSVSSTIAKSSPGAGSSSATGPGTGTRWGHGDKVGTRGHAARPGKLQKIGKIFKIHPFWQKTPCAAPEDGVWLNHGEMPPPRSRRGQEVGLILPTMATVVTRPGRDASTGWDTTLGWTPTQWHPWMGSDGHPAVTPIILGCFPRSR